MRHRDAIDRLHHETRRRSDGGTGDIALGLLLFSLGVGLDLGRIPISIVIMIPIIIGSLQRYVVWARVGYSRDPRREVGELTRLYFASFVVLTALMWAFGPAGLIPASDGMRGDPVRLLSLAAALAMPGAMAWIAYRLGLRRYYAYAVVLLAIFGFGFAAGFEARAWAIAIASLVVVAVGILRLRRFVKRNPPLQEADGAS